MKIGFAGPASLQMLALHVRNGENLPVGYQNPPMSIWTEQLLRRGHQVVLFTVAPGITEPESFYGDRLTIHIGRQRSRGRARDFFARERRDLVALMKSDPCEIIHANWTYEFALAALDSGQPCLVTAHDAPLRVLRFLPDPYRFMRLCMAWQVARRARHLAAVSSYIADHFRQYFRFRHPIHVVPNALAPECFELGRLRLSRPRSGPFTVAAVLTGWKGLKNGPVALQAFSILRQKLPDARLLLFGHDYARDGSAEIWAQSKSLAKNVEFAGPVSQPAMLNRLAKEADVLLHPSLEESFGMAVAEAMALGVTVVAGRNSGAVPSLLEHGLVGELVDVKSPQVIADALARLASDPTIRHRMAVNAFESALRRFESSVVMRALETIYQHVC